jgi:hypothetical protein
MARKNPKTRPLTSDEQSDVKWAKQSAKTFSKGTHKASETGATRRALIKNVKKSLKSEY